MIKIKIKQNKSYPGDNSIQIQAALENGDRIGILNLYPMRQNRKLYYENDRVDGVFESIGEAKRYCKDNIDALLPILIVSQN